jgi:hypothetical protein
MFAGNVCNQYTFPCIQFRYLKYSSILNLDVFSYFFDTAGLHSRIVLVFDFDDEFSEGGLNYMAISPSSFLNET